LLGVIASKMIVAEVEKKKTKGKVLSVIYKFN